MFDLLMFGGLFSDSKTTQAEAKRRQYMDEVAKMKQSIFQSTEAGIYDSIAKSIGVGSRATPNTMTYDQFIADSIFIKSKSEPAPEVSVEEIHREFLTAGDTMLEKAKEVIAQSVIQDEDKVVQMQRFGFNQNKQVVQASQIQQKIKNEQWVADAIQHFHMEYPNYKFITKLVAEQICHKYGLVMGEVSKFRGFVPKKNVDEIAAFFAAYPEDEFGYFYRGLKGKQWPVSKDYVGATRERVDLTICAPLKDMDTTDMQVKGVQLVAKQYPDPVVLLPKKYTNGTEGFLILTAWGDEATDELVVDQNKN